MPSPFPGMDPFLEHPGIFPGLHDRLIAYLSESLQARLPEPYYAEIGERLWVETSDRSIGPDVYVLEDEGRDREGQGGGKVGVGLLTEVRSQPVVVTVPQDEFREPYVEIRASGDNERVVTAIEVLSLTNKTLGVRGRDLYLRKQREILASPIHLVEIDLLRGGHHTTAVPLRRARAKTGPFDYHVCIHRFDHLEDYLVYPIRLQDRLPEIGIPLLPGDRDVVLDLQDVFQRSYDAGPYRRRIRYRDTEPVPPLDPENLQWTAQLLHGMA
ncbi:MAG: DUF4058 family protein [Pirellulaceae bacterium]|nr:DUF4058 family protein [Pirellulaceae bacterium]